MPFKDKEKQKRAQREWVKQKRGLSNPVEPDGSKLVESARKPLKLSRHTTLSNLPLERIERITSINQRRKELGLEDDSAERLERARGYRDWETMANECSRLGL